MEGRESSHEIFIAIGEAYCLQLIQSVISMEGKCIHSGVTAFFEEILFGLKNAL